MTLASYQVATDSNTSTPDPVQVHNGSTSVDTNGNASSTSVTSYSAMDTKDYAGTGHPLDNATDSYGRPVHYQALTKDSLVTLNGTTASLETLQKIGYARQVEGKWDVVNTEAIAQATQQEAAQAEVDHYNSLDLHPEVLENHMSNLIEPIPQPVYDNAIARYAETLDVSKLDISGIAASSGQTDEQVKSSLDFIQNTFTAQVEASLGADTGSVMEWAKANNEQGLKDAMRKLLIERSLSGFTNLHKDFQSDCSTEAQVHRAVNYLRSQGIQVNKKGSEWVVKTDVGETSLQNAFKQGYVRWAGGKGKK
jgi:hypothetical protein